MARILIADDSLMIRTLLREILEHGGHHIVGEAHDGLQAEARVRSLLPDLVTLDLVMPVCGGLECLPHLLAVDPPPAVVICSAVHSERRVIAALRLGAIGFIVKPFTRDSVLTDVEVALCAVRSPQAARGTSPPRPLSQTPDGEANDDQREFMRIASTLAIRVTPAGGRPLITTTVDLSGNGLLLSSGQLAPDTRVDFHLELGAGQPPIAGRARVARLDGSGRPAPSFEQISIEDHERLIAYVHRHPSSKPEVDSVST